ncbi:MAG: IPT/TIG domain-containing protein, partial [Proteobacteria bacterium]|nr:IPT/TIG domain-containing protein [Pseudomonadota bacterium]
MKRFLALVVIGMLMTSCATSVDEEESKPHGPGTPGTPTTPTPSDPSAPIPSTPEQPTPSNPGTPSTPVAVPSISLMVPTSGKVGTEVTIRGRNLENTKQVCFATQCTAPTSVTADAITVKAPEMTGAV